MNGNNNGKNCHRNNNGWQRVNNKYNQDGSNNGPFGNNTQGPMNGPFDGNSSRNNGRHDGGLESIFGFAFYIMQLTFEIAVKAFEIIFHAFGEVFSGKRHKPTHSESRTNKKTDNRTEKKSDSKNAYGVPEQEVKETQETKLSMIRKDGLIILFLMMTIPLIVLVAMKQIIIAAIVLGGGVLAMTLFNVIISGAIKKKEKIKEINKTDIDGENASESFELEKVIEKAFDKIFEIRKDMVLIPDGVVKDKIESICSISEKIIGEVRSAPGIYSQSKRFFYYNLESFNEIFNKYVKLLNYREDSAETNRTLFETEKAFGNIEAIFKEILTKVLERDLINLKAEIDVMNSSR